MPTIKGPIKLGKNMSKEDIKKLGEHISFKKLSSVKPKESNKTKNMTE